MAKQHARRPRATVRGWEVYRPLLDRLVLVLALFGVLVTVHLAIQKARGFDQGCFGFSAPASVEATFDCQAVVSSGAGDVFGVSNVALGTLFYVLVAALSAGVALTSGKVVGRLKRLRAALIGIGMVFTAYLVYYQYAVLGEYCALCMTSAVVVTALFVLQVIDYFSQLDRNRTAMISKNRMREAALYTAAVVVAVVLAGADLLYFKNLEPAPTAQAAEQQPVAAPAAAPGQQPAEECRYDAERPPLPNYKQLVDFTDPMKGNAKAPVMVIEVFEPNCPHCATLHPVMQRVAAANAKTAAFYFKPVRFWEISTLQVAALYGAAQEGKFFDMLDRQFAMQQRGGLNLQQIQGIAREIGMNPTTLAERINQGAYMPRMQQQYMLLVQQAGINSVPAVLINGRFVATKSEQCLNQLIAQAATPKS